MKIKSAHGLGVVFGVFVLFAGLWPAVAADEADLKQFVLNIPEGKDVGTLYRVLKGGMIERVAELSKDVVVSFKEKYQPLKEYSATSKDVKSLPPMVVKDLSSNFTILTFHGATGEVSRIKLSDPAKTKQIDVTYEQDDPKAIREVLMIRSVIPKQEVVAVEEVKAKKEEAPAETPAVVTPGVPPVTKGKPPVTPRQRPPAPTPQPCQVFISGGVPELQAQAGTVAAFIWMTGMNQPQSVTASYVQGLVAKFGVVGEPTQGIPGVPRTSTRSWSLVNVDCDDIRLPSPPVAQPPVTPVIPPAPPTPEEPPQLVQICWYDPYTGSVAWTGIAVVGGEIIDSPAPGYNPMGFYGGTTVTFPPGVTPFPYGPVTTTVIQTPYGTSYTVTCGYIPEEFLPPQPEPPQPPQPPLPISWPGTPGTPSVVPPEVHDFLKRLGLTPIADIEKIKPDITVHTLTRYGLNGEEIKVPEGCYQLPDGRIVQVGGNETLHAVTLSEAGILDEKEMYALARFLKTVAERESFFGEYRDFFRGFGNVGVLTNGDLGDVVDRGNNNQQLTPVGTLVLVSGAAVGFGGDANAQFNGQKGSSFVGPDGQTEFFTDGGNGLNQRVTETTQTLLKEEGFDPNQIAVITNPTTTREEKVATVQKAVESGQVASDSPVVRSINSSRTITGSTVTFNKDGGATFSSGKDSTTRSGTVSGGTTSNKTTETKSQQKK